MLLITAAIAMMQSSVPVSSLDLSHVQQGWGSPKANLSVDGNPITIGGRTFENGLGTHAESMLAIDLGKKALRFTANVGVDDEALEGKGSVEFKLVGDGKALWQSGVIRRGDQAKRVDVSIAGISRLMLIVTDGGDGIDHDHADWAEAAIELLPGENANAIKTGPLAMGADLPIAKRHTGPEPKIHGPRVIGGTPGREFLFKIPATGERPMKFEAIGLEGELKLDETRGILSGKTPPEGSLALKIVVTNAHGKDERGFRIVSGSHLLALTPPMGWNSWNVWGTSVDADKVRAAAKAFIDTGLADYGYAYINIDDGWEAGRNAAGEIEANEKFPDMKALTTHVHDLGLKIGIYSSPGPKTCAGYEGSYQHELQDARSYARWGFDFLKYDWCSYGQIAKDKSLEEYQKPYRLMREMLDRVDRDIVYSLCQYGMGEVWNWGAEVGGDMWRTTGDITDTWSSMSTLGFGEIDRVAKSGPGGWNDPDMMVIGHVGWGPDIRPSRLSRNEQITHMTLWAMLGTPILLGNDLTRMDDFTKDLLMNHDVLEVNQDPIANPARRVAKQGDTEVWIRHLFDGSIAVALFNRGFEEAEVRASWREIGTETPTEIRELWIGKDIASPGNGLSRTIPGHGAVMFRVWR
ncbi:MAG: NPCBM/NEW2 domain-containing protein [Armatimonadota bacterium]|nr:NPCBM/NEW2 domain-containing protein [Armatimonadota bacterium]